MLFFPLERCDIHCIWYFRFVWELLKNIYCCTYYFDINIFCMSRKSLLAFIYEVVFWLYKFRLTIFIVQHTKDVAPVHWFCSAFEESVHLFTYEHNTSVSFTLLLIFFSLCIFPIIWLWYSLVWYSCFFCSFTEHLGSMHL